MKSSSVDKFIGGWFVGDFEPTLLRTGEFEAACKYYKAGDREAAHVHKVASEFTVIASGRVRMNDREYGAGAVILLEPGDATDFEALDDTITFVVKTPCVKNDKYPVEAPA